MIPYGEFRGHPAKRPAMSRGSLVPTAVFVSGNGTNLQAVLDATRAGRLPLDIKLVVCDTPQARALDRAASADVPTAVLTWLRGSESRAEYARRLASTVESSGVRLILLLGWMHVLAPEFLEADFDGILNLHPSFLPDDPSADEVALPDGTRSPVFRGAHAVRDAIAANVTMTGATLIEITPAVDRGRVLSRRELALRADDDEASASARLQPIEHEVVIDGVTAWLRAKGLAAVS